MARRPNPAGLCNRRRATTPDAHVFIAHALPLRHAAERRWLPTCTPLRRRNLAEGVGLCYRAIRDANLESRFLCFVAGLFGQSRDPPSELRTGNRRPVEGSRFRRNRWRKIEEKEAADGEFQPRPPTRSGREDACLVNPPQAQRPSWIEWQSSPKRSPRTEKGSRGHDADRKK